MAESDLLAVDCVPSPSHPSVGVGPVRHVVGRCGTSSPPPHPAGAAPLAQAPGSRARLALRKYKRKRGLEVPDGRVSRAHPRSPSANRRRSRTPRGSSPGIGFRGRGGPHRSVGSRCRRAGGASTGHGSTTIPAASPDLCASLRHWPYPLADGAVWPAGLRWLHGPVVPPRPDGGGGTPSLDPGQRARAAAGGESGCVAARDRCWMDRRLVRARRRPTLAEARHGSGRAMAAPPGRTAVRFRRALRCRCHEAAAAERFRFDRR